MAKDKDHNLIQALKLESTWLNPLKRQIGRQDERRIIGNNKK